MATMAAERTRGLGGSETADSMVQTIAVDKTGGAGVVTVAPPSLGTVGVAMRVRWDGSSGRSRPE